jgi:hypothetical protein
MSCCHETRAPMCAVHAWTNEKTLDVSVELRSVCTKRNGQAERGILCVHGTRCVRFARKTLVRTVFDARIRFRVQRLFVRLSRAPCALSTDVRFKKKKTLPGARTACTYSPRRYTDACARSNGFFLSFFLLLLIFYFIFFWFFPPTDLFRIINVVIVVIRTVYILLHTFRLIFMHPSASKGTMVKCFFFFFLFLSNSIISTEPQTTMPGVYYYVYVRYT